MRTTGFFRLLADPSEPSRWFLQAPLNESGIEVDPRLFTQGATLGPQRRLTLPLRRPGKPVGFNFCDFDMVVTPSAVNAALKRLVGPAVQRIPISIDGADCDFEILNVCDLVDCIDESRSLFTKWTDFDEYPEKYGQYRMIVKLRIDPVRAQGHHIFRLVGWPISLVVSEEVKALFESCNLTGIKYDRVD